PDPPSEFEGFIEETETDGFAVLEVNVEQKVDLYDYDNRRNESRSRNKQVAKKHSRPGGDGAQ
ncbi:MAG TPA: hypothetical protein VEG34_15425, partial [Thermoanaerobaculia bacterium]|nr:hypothetical protein [Thermoanaerobaculia bacterium]